MIPVVEKQRMRDTICDLTALEGKGKASFNEMDHGSWLLGGWRNGVNVNLEEKRWQQWEWRS